jgi:hypothetical protein
MYKEYYNSHPLLHQKYTLGKTYLNLIIIFQGTSSLLASRIVPYKCITFAVKVKHFVFCKYHECRKTHGHMYVVPCEQIFAQCANKIT